MAPDFEQNSKRWIGRIWTGPATRLGYNPADHYLVRNWSPSYEGESDDDRWTCDKAYQVVSPDDEGFDARLDVLVKQIKAGPIVSYGCPELPPGLPVAVVIYSKHSPLVVAVYRQYQIAAGNVLTAACVMVDRDGQSPGPTIRLKRS